GGGGRPGLGGRGGGRRRADDPDDRPRIGAADPRVPARRGGRAGRARPRAPRAAGRPVLREPGAAGHAPAQGERRRGAPPDREGGLTREGGGRFARIGSVSDSRTDGILERTLSGERLSVP